MESRSSEACDCCWLDCVIKQGPELYEEAFDGRQYCPGCGKGPDSIGVASSWLDSAKRN